MSQDQWTAVDRYITDVLIPPDPALEAALQDSHAAGLPAIHVAPDQGKLLHLIARTQRARKHGRDIHDSLLQHAHTIDSWRHV